MDILHGTLRLEHSHLSQFKSIIKSILVLLAKLFLHSHSLIYFQIISPRSSSSSCCATSIVWSKGLVHYCTILTTGVTLASRGNSASKKLREPRSAVSSRLHMLQHPESTIVLEVNCKKLALHANFYGCTLHNKQVSTVHK
jgi:hypothetical protein